MLRRARWRLVGTDRGVRGGPEHKRERHQDGREAAKALPKCPKSRHRRVYTPLAAEE